MSASKEAQCRQDSGRSWLVAAACSWCLFWTMIVNRCGGIVFVTMINEMGASRQAASWPFSLLGTVSNIFGLVSGVLLRKLPLRTVSILGSLLVASGILLSVAFYGVIGITLCIGIITSIGQGLIFPSNMVAINAHFKKYRASGSGISYIGGTLVSFIFPPLLVHLNDKFGLHDTLLIVGALTLNAVAGSLLVAKPDDVLGRSRRRQPRAVELKGLGKENGYPEKDEQQPLNKVAQNGPQGEQAGGSEKSDRITALLNELSFMKSPIYYVIVVTGVVFAYNLVMFGVTIVDHGISKGLSKWEAAALLSCYGAGDFVGRISSGILSDKKICHRRDIMAVGFLATSGALVGVIYASSMVLLGAASVVFGLTSGSIMILFSVLLVEYFGLKKLPMAIGFHCLVNGLATLPRPFLIGFFRDSGSSYESMYMLLAAVSLVTSVVWAIECFVQWRAQKAELDKTASPVEPKA